MNREPMKRISGVKDDPELVPVINKIAVFLLLLPDYLLCGGTNRGVTVLIEQWKTLAGEKRADVSAGSKLWTPKPGADAPIWNILLSDPIPVALRAPQPETRAKDARKRLRARLPVLFDDILVLSQNKSNLNQLRRARTGIRAWYRSHYLHFPWIPTETAAWLFDIRLRAIEATISRILEPDLIHRSTELFLPSDSARDRLKEKRLMTLFSYIGNASSGYLASYKLPSVREIDPPRNIDEIIRRHVLWLSRSHSETHFEQDNAIYKYIFERIKKDLMIVARTTALEAMMLLPIFPDKYYSLCGVVKTRYIV